MSSGGTRLCAAVALVAWLAPCRAQAPARLVGTVTDSTGAVLPGARITVVELDRKVERLARTDYAGAYRLVLLPPGSYRVTVQMEGFQPVSRWGLTLRPSQSARLDFVMQLPTRLERVEISGSRAPAPLDPLDQSLGADQVSALALDGRNYLHAAGLLPNVLPSQFLGRGSRTGEEGGFVALGVHSYQNEIFLDGNDNSSRAGGGALGFEVQAVKPAVDAVAEVRFVTCNTSAEYGFRTGSKVLVSTKAGTGAFHGSVYEFFRHDRLDAANFFANRAGASKPRHRVNQFGATLGGPVSERGTFFFASFQGSRLRVGRNYTSTLPSRGILADGDFSREPAVRRNIFDPLTLTGTGPAAMRAPFPANVLPPSRIDPVVRTAVSLYPAPNVAGRENLPYNYFYAPSDTDSADQYDIRVDHSWGATHRALLRYSARDQRKRQPGVLPFPAMGGAGQNVTLSGSNVVMNVAGAAGAAGFHEFRFGWSQLHTLLDIPFDENWNPALGITGSPGDVFGDGLDHGFARFAPAGFAELGPRSFWPNRNNFDNMLAAGSFAWQTARHGIKAGAEFRRSNIFRQAQRFRRGFWSFSGVYTAQRPNQGASRAATGNPMADMLLGMASGGMIGNADSADVIVPYYGLFVQDDWRATSRLTVGIGLRWELFPGGHFPNPASQPVGRWLTGQERMTYPAGGGDCGCRNDWNNFAPRLGISYAWNAATVLRAGAGLHYGQPDVPDVEGVGYRPAPPAFREVHLDQPRESSGLLVRAGFPALPSGFPADTTVDAMPEFRPTMYSGQWFFGVERAVAGRAVVGLAYNGTKSTHLAVTRDINLPLAPHPWARWQERRVRPFFYNVLWHENSANAVYHALSVRAEKRSTRGLRLLGSFTWAHNIDAADEFFLEGPGGRASQYDLRRERGNSSLDRRLALSLQASYELPLASLAGARRGWARRIFEDWQVNGVLSSLSGMPADHRVTVDNQNLAGAVRGDWVSNPNLPASARSVDRWFDTGFVRPGAPGVISNAGRNLIYCPGSVALDFSISRQFRLRPEEGRLEFRAEVFNAANTPRFGAPNILLGSPGEGVITSAGQPRHLQFVMRYSF